MSVRDIIQAAAGAGGAAETDANFNQTVLLLHGDGTNGAQNNTFLDGSTNNFTITRNGNTTQGTFSPFSVGAGEWSNFFDGTGDYLLFPNNAAFAFGTGAFTIEFWINAPLNNDKFILGGRAAIGTMHITTGGFSSTAGVLRYIGSSTIVSSNVITDNSWHHCAIVRDGSNNITLYVDGISVGTGTDTTNYTSTSGTWVIGANDNNYPSGLSNNQLTGYLSNVRVVKGTAIVPPTGGPTTPLTAITNTSLLTCQSNRFVDNSTNAFAITRNGDVRVTPFSPFAPSAEYFAGTNGGSGFFDGTGDYLTVANNSAFDFAGGDFTIEGWFYRQAAVTQRIIAKRATGTGFGPFLIAISGGGQVSFFASFNGTTNGLTLNSSVSANLLEWNHFAVTRSGSSWTLWLNGASSATTTNASSVVANTDAVSIGVGSADGTSGIYTGYLADIRFVKGTAVYTSAFTPPTAPVTAITNTSLLLNFTNAGIFDNTGKNNLETVGNAQIDTTTKKFGTGSMEFDGTGDYLQIPNDPNFNLGTGDFTIEMWFYIAGNSALDGNNNRTAHLLTAYPTSGSGATGYGLSVGGNSTTTGTNIRFYNQVSGTEYAITYTASISQTTWHHVAVVRSGTTTTIYFNGSSVASGTLGNQNISNSTHPLRIASLNYTGYLQDFNGFIDDLRITKGVARYPTEPFPTKAFPDQ